MKAICKYNIFILFLAILITSGNSQNRWDQRTVIPASYPGLDKVYDVQFPENADIGYCLIRSTVNGNVYYALLRTTNKGLHWGYEIPINTEYELEPSIYFINSSTGWYCEPTIPDNTGRLYRTTNGGNTYPLVNSDWFWTKPRMIFTDVNTGYLFNINRTYLTKTINGGYNIYNVEFGGGGNYIINEVSISSNNSNLVYVCGYRNSDHKPFLAKSATGFENGQYEVIFDASHIPNINISEIEHVFVVNSNGLDLIYFTTYYGLYKLESDNSVSIIYLFGEGLTSFLSSSQIIHYYRSAFDSKVIGSTDGGLTFNQEFDIGYNFNPDLRKIATRGDAAWIMYHNFSSNDTKMAYRKLNMYMAAVTETQTLQGEMTVNSGDATQTFSTPSNQYVMAGTSYLSVPSVVNNKVFYCWDNNLNMNNSNNVFYFDRDGAMPFPYYKDHLVSNVSYAMGSPQQTKAIKDTVINNAEVIHMVYQSMGGVFYTKSTDNGITFKPEEVVNKTLTADQADCNKNACLNVIRTQQGVPITTQDQEKNVACVWERYNYGAGRDEIKVSKRGSNGTWFMDYTSGPDFITSFSASEVFESKPKIFVCTYGTGDNDYVYVIPHLVPAGNINKILVTAKKGYQSIDFTIDEGDISEWAVAAPYNMNGMFALHFAYKKNGVICYRYTEIGWDVNLHITMQQTSPVLIVSHEVQNFRFNPDIALRNASLDPGFVNMQPVICYQGQYTVRIATENEETGVQYVQSTQYPIIIRERKPNGEWASTNIAYNSAAPQQNPSIEGSKKRDSYMINYSQNSVTFFQKLPKWEGIPLPVYFCSPGAYNYLKYAGYVKGGLVDQYTKQQSVLTIENSNGPYAINKNRCDITNLRTKDDIFDAVNGIAIVDNIAYSFNLGSIMVNGNMINFDYNIDTTIATTAQLNDVMKSKNFQLYTNDTLVLGRDGYYVPSDSAGTFIGIQYWVDLINNTTGLVFRNLIHDTLKVNDTIHIDYLDGFVIRDISGGVDSFYVQLRIDTIHANTVGSDLISSDSTIAFGGTNKLGIKRKIFWHDGRTDKGRQIPLAFNLYQNYPNPFNPVTTIKYDLPKDVNVTIKVYDLLGKEVTRLVNNEFRQAGAYQLFWNANNYASGVYICRIQAGDYVSIKKMVLLK